MKKKIIKEQDLYDKHFELAMDIAYINLQINELQKELKQKTEEFQKADAELEIALSQSSNSVN